MRLNGNISLLRLRLAVDLDHAILHIQVNILFRRNRILIRTVVSHRNTALL